MPTSDMVERTKSILFGAGIGEKPVILRLAADAAESISGDIVTFDMTDSTEAANLDGGDVVGVWGAAAATNAHMAYVISVASATVTAVNAYNGSPAIADTNLDGGLLEVIPGGGIGEHNIYQAIETVFTSLLWPDLWEYATYAITPDLTDFQVELNAAVEKIEDAWQVIGSTRYEVAFEMAKNVHTSVSSTTVLAELLAFDSSNVFITTVNRITESSTLSEALRQMIATGAAAIAAGMTRNPATMESTGKDNQMRIERSPARALWQDFGTLRTALAGDLEQEVHWFEYDRG